MSNLDKCTQLHLNSVPIKTLAGTLASMLTQAKCIFLVDNFVYCILNGHIYTSQLKKAYKLKRIVNLYI